MELIESVLGWLRPGTAEDSAAERVEAFTAEPSDRSSMAEFVRLLRAHDGEGLDEGTA